ncbi:MAG: flagellar basal-body MS-ring/collar protein FliF [Sandaracinaceae bacterium]
MDALRTQLEALKARYAALSPRARVGGLVGISVAVAIAVLLYAQSSTPTQAVLFSNLSASDAGRIVERLRAMNVEYELVEGGNTIRVPDDAVHETRLTLANEGLPSGGGVGFEIFDTARFGESDFSEQVQYRRALEGELARTISHLAGVESARVHLVLPERTLFAAEESQASASVALHLTPGWQLRDDQVEGVGHLVASSVRGLSPDRVTVVDQEGHPLSSPDGDDETVDASDAESLRAQIERSRQRAVQQLLDASLGAGVAVVRVSADVNMSREEQLFETYDPERTATRSLELEEERDPSAEGAGQGVPGAASNLPGGQGAEAGPDTTGLSRRTERRNFEITKTVRRAVTPVGRIARLTVAVVVDGNWTGEGDERTFAPREEEEVTRIRSLVSTAAGINADRGDVVTVECVPFASSADPPAAFVEDPFAPYLPYVPYAAGVIVFLVLFVYFLLWRRRRKKEEEAAQEERMRAIEAGEIDELDTPVPVGALPDKPEPSAQKTLGDYESLRALSLEVARRDPELAARVVRGWLAESPASKPEEEPQEAAA